MDSMESKLYELVKKAVREVLLEQKQVTENLPDVMNVKEASTYIKMSVSWLRQNKDKIPYFTEGSRILYRTKDLKKYIENKDNFKNQKSNIRISPCKFKRIN